MERKSQNITVEMPIAAIIYRSRCAMEITPLILASIVEQAVVNNRRDNITGMLLFDNEHFVQYIEGAPAKVSACFERICADERHTSMQVLLHKRIAQRELPKWNMKLLHELPSGRAMIGSNDLTDYFYQAVA